MTNEAIEKIKAAESAAASEVADAKRMAAEIRSKAIAGVEALERATEKKSAEYARAAEEKSLEKADGIITNGISAARLEAKKMLSDASRRTDEAVDEVIRGIFEKWQ